jgi:hypothetical protein
MSFLCFLSQYLLSCTKKSGSGTWGQEGALFAELREIPESKKKERRRMCGRPS